MTLFEWESCGGGGCSHGVGVGFVGPAGHAGGLKSTIPAQEQAYATEHISS